MTTELIRRIEAAERKLAGATAESVNAVMAAALDNANVTCHVEHAAPAEDWERIFRGSAESMLACNPYGKPVHTFFAKFGIAP